MPSIVDKVAEALHIPRHHAHAEAPAVAADAKTPVFESSKVTVIFVLGGPGAGAFLAASPYNTTLIL